MVGKIALNVVAIAHLESRINPDDRTNESLGVYCWTSGLRTKLIKKYPKSYETLKSQMAFLKSELKAYKLKNASVYNTENEYCRPNIMSNKDRRQAAYDWTRKNCYVKYQI